MFHENRRFQQLPPFCRHVKSSRIAICQHFLTWPDLFFLLELARLTGSSSLNMTDGTPLGHDPAARRDLTWGRTVRDPTGSGMTCGFLVPPIE